MKMIRRLFIGILLFALVGVVLVLRGLPTTLYADPGFGNHYAAAYQFSGIPKYTGAKSDVEVAIPILRDCVEEGCPSGDTFSAAAVFVHRFGVPDRWVEAGWARDAGENCQVKHYWAIQPGDPNFIQSPLPWIGYRYEYRVAQDQANGKWSVKIWLVDNNSNRIRKEWEKKDINPGFTVGHRILAQGETFYSQENDMEVSGLLYLKWRDTNRKWHGWHGWEHWSTGDLPPYYVVGIPPDDDNNVQVYGNQGNPVPPDAACPHDW